MNFHNVQLPDSSYVIECLAQVYDELKSRKALIGGDLVEWEYFWLESLRARFWM